MRKLYEIARDIQRDWTRPYFGAVPYIQAMSSLSEVEDQYGCDDAESIIRYFLANASTWRGDVARRIKSELKNMIGA